MRLDVRFSAGVGRVDRSEYVRSLEVAVVCYGEEEGEDEYVVGRLGLDQILWSDAQVDGVPLHLVCDNDSSGMVELYESLTEDGEEFRTELGIEMPASHVLFLHAAVFHPCVHAHRQGILDAAFRLMGGDCLAVMWRDTSGLPQAQLTQLGFRRAAGSELVYRHSMNRTPFGDAHPRGIDASGVVAEPAFQEWVAQQWRQLVDGEREDEGETA